MTGPIVFDIETHSVTEMYAREWSQFFRIGGLSLLSNENVNVSSDPTVFRALLKQATVAIGHNILAFDLPALGIRDLLERTRDRRVIDTWTLATVLDTVPDSYVNQAGNRVFIMKPEQAKRYYALDNLAFQYGVPGKTHDLKKLAKERGDADACCTFGSIPTNDPDYREYLEADVNASRSVLGALLAKFSPNGLSEYAWREMRVAAIGSTVSMNGFRLDRELAQQRIDANEEVRRRNTQMLVDRYGLPMTNKAGKPSKNPIATEEGKRSILNALYAAGIRSEELPRTAKNQPSLGAEGLQGLASQYPDNELLGNIVEAVAGVQGLRTVYQTAMDNVHADGFCHPDVFMLQASGRLSFQNPGLTVFGKRGGRHVERGIFVGDVLPDEDEDFHVLFAADFSQIDARAVGAHSQDHAYLDKFEGGRDLHMENARTVWGQSAGKQEREWAKPIGHGWNYGMGLGKLSGIAGEKIAREFMDAMTRSHPNLVRWKEQMAQIATHTGRLDNGFGRIMKANRERAYTQGPALVGQGAARDLMFHALLKMDFNVLRMLKAIVHDEVVFSVPKSVAVEVRNHVVECMTFEWAPPGAVRPVPIVADASKFGLRWSDLYE